MYFSWIEVVIVAAIVVLIGVIAWALYSEGQRPTIEIKKDDWECVKSEDRTHLQPMLVGRTTMLMPMTTTVCLDYKRVAG